MAENSQIWQKTWNVNNQEPQGTPSKMNSKRFTLRHYYQSSKRQRENRQMRLYKT